MAKYRQKAPEFDAVLYDGAVVGEPDGHGGVKLGTCPDWMPKAEREVNHDERLQRGQAATCGCDLVFGTPVGTRKAEPGDWIVRDPGGVIHPVKAAAFAQFYEPVPE